MTRYWDIAHDIFPGSRTSLPSSFWRRQVIRLLSNGSAAPTADNVTDLDVIAAMRSPSRRAPDRTTNLPKTVHCIGSLGAGGAERQLVNLMTTLHERGHNDQTLLTINPLHGDDAHYSDLLASHDIEIRTNNSPIREAGVELIRNNPETVDLLKHLPSSFNAWSLDLWVELSLLAPDVAHFWLDHSNIWGGPAALLAGIPAVVLSTRNVHPGNFPYLHTPYMRPWYEVLEQCPRVHFINNSHPGGDSYAEWLGVSPKRFDIVLNGVNLSQMHPLGETEQRDVRKQIGIPADAPAIVGAFRFSEEKRPLLFVETAAKAMAKFPDLHAVLMGDGPLRPDIEKRLDELGLKDRFHLLGRRSDLASIMSSMDVFLHTAWWEGTPNVVLEAQQLCLPVVVSDGGGSADAVDHEGTGLLVNREDEAGLAIALISILEDLDKWKKRAQRGPQFIAERFSIDRMINETLAVQRKAIGASIPSGASARKFKVA
tara:strand:+ start:843 stop:2294 length:1452 start_codon:yes stop_codon:yes gene_type:complete